MRSRIGSHAARRFLEDLDEGRYVLAPISADVYHQAVAVDRQHADLDLGLVDASVVAVAAAVDAQAIATLDHAHLRAATGGRTRLVPDESQI